MMLCDARRLGVWGGAGLALVLLLSAAWGSTAPIQQNDATLRSSEASSLRSTSWQYRDLDALSQAGLIVGHPKAPLSTWAEGLTRYEAASLVLRAVEGVGNAYQAQGQALVQIAQAEGAGEVSPPAGVTPEDLARVEKLIEEFRAELVTRGVKVDNLATAVKDVQQRLAKVEAEQKQHKIDGYLQLRFRDDNATDGRREFLVRNARINVRGPVSARAAYRIEMQFDSKETGKGPGSKAQLRTATIDYLTGPTSRIRMGQMVVPWGYELEVPTQDLWSGERALFMDRLFPDQRDLGLEFSSQRSPKAPKLDLGFFNGSGIDMTDNNNNQNLLARVDFPLKNGSIALSGYAGTNNEGTARTRQDRDAVSAKYAWGDTQFLGEFVAGNDKGKDIRGWYGQIGHPLTKKSANLLFAKYDQYDEDRSKPNDLFKRWTLGYWYDLDKATRLILACELRDVGANFTKSERTKWNGNAAYMQLQVKF
jgi:hypothetical protein